MSFLNIFHSNIKISYCKFTTQYLCDKILVNSHLIELLVNI